MFFTYLSHPVLGLSGDIFARRCTHSSIDVRRWPGCLFRSFWTMSMGEIGRMTFFGIISFPYPWGRAPESQVKGSYATSLCAKVGTCAAHPKCPSSILEVRVFDAGQTWTGNVVEWEQANSSRNKPTLVPCLVLTSLSTGCVPSLTCFLSSSHRPFCKI